MIASQRNPRPLGRGGCQGGAFKARVGKSGNNQIQKALDALQKLEYVEHAASAWRISSPFRWVWLARIAGYPDPA